MVLFQPSPGGPRDDEATAPQSEHSGCDREGRLTNGGRNKTIEDAHTK